MLWLLIGLISIIYLCIDVRLPTRRKQIDGHRMEDKIIRVNTIQILQTLTDEDDKEQEIIQYIYDVI